MVDLNRKNMKNLHQDFDVRWLIFICFIISQKLFSLEDKTLALTYISFFVVVCHRDSGRNEFGAGSK